MKTILQDHDAVIESYLQPKVSEPANEGEIVDHKQVVSGVVFHRPRVDLGGNIIFEKVTLSKKFIEDCYNNIKEIESIIIQAPYDNLPF